MQDAPRVHSRQEQCRKASGHQLAPSSFAEASGHSLALAALRTIAKNSNSRQEQGENATSRIQRSQAPQPGCTTGGHVIRYMYGVRLPQSDTLFRGLDRFLKNRGLMLFAVRVSTSQMEPDWEGPKSRLLGILGQAAEPLTAGACRQRPRCPACLSSCLSHAAAPYSCPYMPALTGFLVPSASHQQLALHSLLCR